MMMNTSLIARMSMMMKSLGKKSQKKSDQRKIIKSKEVLIRATITFRSSKRR